MKQLVVAAGVMAVAGMSQAGLVHEYNFDVNGADSVGTADLDINGTASVSGGNLNLPGGAPRTNNASATGAALAELGSTINGTDELTVVVRYNATTTQDWAKLFMTGSGEDNFIDITHSRPGQGSGAGIETAPASELIAIVPTPTGNGVDGIAIAIWDETTDMMTLHIAEDGNVGSLQTTTIGMGGQDLANLIVAEFYIGAAVAFGDPDFNGTIDQVQIYDHALTTSEATALIPEPGSLALLGLGGLAILRRRRS